MSLNALEAAAALAKIGLATMTNEPSGTADLSYRGTRARGVYVRLHGHWATFIGENGLQTIPASAVDHIEWL